MNDTYVRTYICNNILVILIDYSTAQMQLDTNAHGSWTGKLCVHLQNELQTGAGSSNDLISVRQPECLLSIYNQEFTAPVLIKK